MKEPFDPEDIGMVFCPLCNGDGKTPEGHEGCNVCRQCGGFGIILEKKDMLEKKTVGFRSVRFLLPS